MIREGAGNTQVEKYCKEKKGLFTVHLFPPLSLYSSLYCATGGSLHHSVPLSVWRGWQHIASFHSSLGQIFLVFGHSRANSSILPVEKACAAVLQVLRVVQWGLWGETVLPVFRIVKSGLLAFLIKHDGAAGDAWVQSVSWMSWMQGVWWIWWVGEVARRYHISSGWNSVAWCWWVDCLRYWMGCRGPRAGDGDCSSQSILVPRANKGVQVQWLIYILIVPVGGLDLGGSSSHVQSVTTCSINNYMGVTIPPTCDEGVFLHRVEIVWKQIEDRKIS